MINISDRDKEIWETSSVHKELEIKIPSKNIVLTNNDIVYESMDLVESIESEMSLSFVGLFASKFSFECADMPQTIVGEYIEATMLAEGTQEPIPLFSGYIDEVTNLTHEDNTMKITAYDRLYDICGTDLVDWYNGLKFPMSLYNFRTSLFAYLGVEQEPTALIFDGLIVDKTVEPEQLSAKDIISNICQLNCVFGRINRNDRFEFLKLEPIIEGVYPSNDLYPSDDLYPADDSPSHFIDNGHCKKVTYQNYKTALIDKVQIRQDEDDIGAIYGNGNNAYVIEDNLLINGKTAAELSNIAKTIYENVERYQYTPANIQCIGVPYLEVGDAVSLATKKNIIRTYVLKRTLKGVQALTDTYESESDEYRESQINSVNTQINRIKGRTNKLSRTIEATNSEISRYEVQTNGVLANHTTLISQNATEITAKVSKTGGTNTSFAWRLNDTAFELISGNKVVFKCNKDGITVDGYTTTAQLNATNARVGSLEADHVSVAQLNATNATLNNLTTKAITTDNLSSQTISASQVKTGTFTANRITTGTVNGHTVVWQRVSCINSGSWGYIFQNNSTNKLVVRNSNADYPGHTLIGGFLNGLSTKGFYTLAQDNA